MTRDRAENSQPPATEPERTPIQVVSAYGAVRIVLVLMAIWTFIEGFALATGGLGALTLGGNDRTAERIIGAQMLVFVPVYALLAFRRERYRLLMWIPYAAQAAIVVPTAWSVLRYADGDGLLLLTVSVFFLAMLIYFWWQSHDPGFFQPEEDEAEDGDEDDDDAPDDRRARGDPDAGSSRRYRRR